MARRAAHGTGTIRKKTITRSGKKYEYWEARYTAGRDPGTGKQIQHSITGKTQKEVAQKLKAATASIDAGTYFEPEKITVGDWIDTWQDEYLGNTKPHTRKSYEGVAKNHIKPAIGAIKLAALTPVQIQKLINNIKSTKKGQTTVSPKTVKNVHGVLHSALEQAVQCGYIRTNPADRAILPKRVKAEIHILEDDMVPQFLKRIEGHKYEYLYQLDLFTGLRESELLGLQWEDIDLDKKVLTVRRQLQYLGGSHGGYQYATPKNNKPRLVMIPDRAVNALRKQRAKQNADRLAAGPLWENSDNLVFTDELGHHIKHDVIYRNLKRIFTAMGAPNLRFHDLRHSYAVMSLQSGCDIKTVQENLGHYAAAFTLDTYGHVTEQMRRQGAQKLDKYLNQISNG